MLITAVHLVQFYKQKKRMMYICSSLGLTLICNPVNMYISAQTLSGTPAQENKGRQRELEDEMDMTTLEHIQCWRSVGLT